eukprot:12923421-Prorocentrum_lima.AAC.1
MCATKGRSCSAETRALASMPMMHVRPLRSGESIVRKVLYSEVSEERVGACAEMQRQGPRGRAMSTTANRGEG